MDRAWRVRQFDTHRVCLGTVFVLFMLNSVSAQPDVDGLCSNSVRTTVTYTTTDQISRSLRTTVGCGFFNWQRCTAYRIVYSAEPRIAYRDTYTLVSVCCDGWEPQADGSCNRITTERASTEPESTSEGTLETNITTPTFPADMLSSESSSSVTPSSSSVTPSSSSVTPSSSATSSGIPPVEIALPEDVFSNNNPSFLEDKRMLGGIGGVAAALIIMVTLMLLLISRRRRRSREKRNAEPGVLFELLTSSSPAQGPTPDIYTEIPAPQNSSCSTGQETVTDQSQSDYEISFVHNQRPSGRVNTYQDVKDLVASCNGINEQKKTAIGKGGACAQMESPTANKMESNVCLGQNGLVYTELDQKVVDNADRAPYQNLKGLDTVVKPPVAFGNGRTSPATSYNKFDRTNPNRIVPTDPDDEAYNTVIIGPTGGEHDTYDKLERQKSAPHHGSEDYLSVSIPVAPGYAALVVTGSNLAYDKLERHEAQGFDPDRHVGSKTRPNTYDKISATGHKKTYDKLQRQHSADRGLNDSPSKAKPSDELPKSDNEYDIVEIGSHVGQPNPAGGEIYENFPKKPKEKCLNDQKPSPDLNTKADSTLESNPVRPLYDLIPGSPRMINAPVYDIVPISPRENGIAPLYDIPPALTQQIKRKESFEGPASPVNQGGTRPVYDTPPLRLDNSSPLQFEETCPVYENTPTSRKQSIY